MQVAGFSTPSPIEQILDKEEFTLEELLQVSVVTLLMSVSVAQKPNDPSVQRPTLPRSLRCHPQEGDIIQECKSLNGRLIAL